MGEKLESYIDPLGNTVRDGDRVFWKGKVYEVIYISHSYVNLMGNGNLHLPFKAGIPTKFLPNKGENLVGEGLDQWKPKKGDYTMGTKQQGAFIGDFNDLVDHVENIPLKDQKDLAEDILRRLTEGHWECHWDGSDLNVSKTESL